MYVQGETVRWAGELRPGDRIQAGPVWRTVSARRLLSDGRTVELIVDGTAIRLSCTEAVCTCRPH